MRQPNIHEVRENLAEYLAAAQRGEEVLICRRNQPVARLVAVARQTGGPRPLGRAADAGTPLPATFWEPLPQALIETLSGHEPAQAVPQARAKRRATRPAKAAGPR